MTNKKIKISWVILTWNSQNNITECLNSIIDCRDISSHIITVDNGSSDTTLSITDSFMRRIKNLNDVSMQSIRLPHNLGTSKTRNIGIKAAHKDSDFICILDDDTIINQEAILFMADILNKNSAAGMAGPEMSGLNGEVQLSAKPFPSLFVKLLKALPGENFKHKTDVMERHWDINSYPKNALYVDYMISACWLIKPEAIEKTGYFDEKYFYAPEDIDYCIRMWKAGYGIIFCPEAKIIHKWQRLSKKKFFSRINYEHLKGLLRMYIMHRCLFSTKNLPGAKNAAKIYLPENHSETKTYALSSLE